MSPVGRGRPGSGPGGSGGLSLPSRAPRGSSRRSCSATPPYPQLCPTSPAGVYCPWRVPAFASCPRLSRGSRRGGCVRSLSVPRHPQAVEVLFNARPWWGAGCALYCCSKAPEGGCTSESPNCLRKGGERVVGNSPSPRRGARPPRKVPFGEGPLSAPEIQLGAPTLDSLHPSSTPHSSGRGASRISSRSQAPNAGPALEVPSGATGAPEAKAAQALLGSAGGRAAGLRDWGGVRKESWRGPRLGAGGTSGREAGRGIRTYSGGESLGSWGWGRVLQGPDLEGTRPWSWGESPSKELGEGRRRARI